MYTYMMCSSYMFVIRMFHRMFTQRDFRHPPPKSPHQKTSSRGVTVSPHAHLVELSACLGSPIWRQPAYRVKPASSESTACAPPTSTGAPGGPSLIAYVTMAGCSSGMRGEGLELDGFSKPAHTVCMFVYGDSKDNSRY